MREGKAADGRALYARIKGDVQAAQQRLEIRGSGAAAAAAPGGAAAAEAGRGAGGGGEAAAEAAPAAGDRRSSSVGLQFELPYTSKYLLLAAYLASRNKPTADRQVCAGVRVRVCLHACACMRVRVSCVRAG
jgi:hypothetical protein